MLNFDFATRNLRYADRACSLTVEAAGIVKSEKHYPVFNIEGKEYIFKPISQSKPFATAFFPLAEAFWSQLLPQYFNVQMPQYYLAECASYHDEVPKYLDTGCISENALASGEHLVNLLEWFNAHPDPAVGIANYENYCYMYYDYVPIFESQLFQSRKDLAEQLAMQVLLSILTADENYHYENVAFVCNEAGEILRLCPPIDHEFSELFAFPDDEPEFLHFLLLHANAIKGKLDEAEMIRHPEYVRRNLEYIINHFPGLTKSFANSLQRLHADMENGTALNSILDAGSPTTLPCDSNAWRVGRALYHDHDPEKAEKNKKYLKKSSINMDEFWSDRIMFLGLLSKVLLDVIDLPFTASYSCPAISKL